MAHDETEAQCLLRTGTLYRRRTGFRAPDGRLVFVGFKPGAFSIYVDDQPIDHFDLEGRWQRSYRDDIHYLKATDARVTLVERLRDDRTLYMTRRTLSLADTISLDASLRDSALELLEGIATGAWAGVPVPDPGAQASTDEIMGILERIARWDASAWFADRERYLATYGVLPYLPPDCPQPLILQLTLGRSGALDFGGVKTSELFVRTASEFRDHVRDVLAWHGRRIEQCREIVLAGPESLLQSPELLRDALGTIEELCPPDLPLRTMLDFEALSRLNSEVVAEVGGRRRTRLDLRIDKVSEPTSDDEEVAKPLKSLGVVVLLDGGASDGPRRDVVRRLPLRSDDRVILVNRPEAREAGDAAREVLKADQAEKRYKIIRDELDPSGP